MDSPWQPIKYKSFRIGLNLKQSFLGFTKFYRCFILHYSDIAVPLTCLTHKRSTWDFSNKCCSAFNTLKKAFTTTLVLTHWIPGSPLIIKTDALDYTLAAILSMVSPMDNEVYPIAFHSHTFMPPELCCDKITMMTFSPIIT